MSSQRCLGSSSMLADHSSSPFSLNAVQDGQSIPLSSSPMEGFLFCNFLCQSVPLILCNVVFCFWFIFQLVSATVPDAAHDKHCTTGTWGSMQDQGGCDAYPSSSALLPKTSSGHSSLIYRRTSPPQHLISCPAQVTFQACTSRPWSSCAAGSSGSGGMESSSVRNTRHWGKCWWLARRTRRCGAAG